MSWLWSGLCLGHDNTYFFIYMYHLYAGCQHMDKHMKWKRVDVVNEVFVTPKLKPQKNSLINDLDRTSNLFCITYPQITLFMSYLNTSSDLYLKNHSLRKYKTKRNILNTGYMLYN